ncbi:hypothetical protein M378DRAFT_168965, partial [Amanita muscaria Koide BX008]
MKWASLIGRMVGSVRTVDNGRLEGNNGNDGWVSMSKGCTAVLSAPKWRWKDAEVPSTSACFISPRIPIQPTTKLVGSSTVSPRLTANRTEG